MVTFACNPSYSGGWGRSISWTWEAEVAREPRLNHCTLALTTRGKLLRKKKTKNPSPLWDWIFLSSTLACLPILSNPFLCFQNYFVVFVLLSLIFVPGILCAVTMGSCFPFCLLFLVCLYEFLWCFYVNLILNIWYFTTLSCLYESSHQFFKVFQT